MEKTTINKKAWFITGLILGALTLVALVLVEMGRAAEDNIRKGTTLFAKIKAFFRALCDKAIWKNCWKSLDADIILMRFSVALIGMLIHWLVIATIL